MSENGYALFGVEPGATATPASVAEALELVRGSAGKAIVPWGGGTRQHIGYPPERYDIVLDTRALNRIVEYEPDDQVVTVQAGLTVAALQSTLAKHGQFLPVDIAQPDVQTVGGVIATRPDSLRRFALGSVRDCLIGVKVVNGRGALIAGGGKVVKNVSGYDLPKLYCGSYGTLGLIVEASFKVSPLPEASATAMLALTADHNSEDVLDRILGSDLSPSFVYLLNPAAAQELLDIPEDASPSQVVIAGFDGPAEAVAWQVRGLNALAAGGSEAVAVSEATPPQPSPWKGEGESESGVPSIPSDIAAIVRARLRDFPNAAATASASFHIMSSQVGAYARMMEWTARRSGFTAKVVADAAVGMVWAQFEPRGAMGNWSVFEKDLTDKALRVGGSFIVERMPDAWRASDMPVWSPLLPDFALMRGIKAALDPDHMWNPGRFVGRI